MPDVISIGLSGARVAKSSLATTSHNIANAQTEGFSRQRVEINTRQPQLTGVGAIGKGVQINNVSRIHDNYVSSEMRSNASIANGLETNYEFTSQIDNMLADPQAGLSPTLHSFFNAINGVSNDPSSLSGRQVLIGEARALSERFSYLDNRFESLRKASNETLKTQINDVNNLSKAIADVNWKVVLAKGLTQNEPSDLLDQREQLLHQLSEKIVTSTTEQEDGALNVFIGNGQTLVVGKDYSSLGLKANQHDPSVLDVIYKKLGVESTITQYMKGGSIGGLLDFRETMLDGAQNELGRIAIGISKSFNDQHHKGMTLENKLGGDFFKAIDKSTPLTLASTNNKGDYAFKTTITNVDNLTVSDYTLNYNAGKYTLVKSSSDMVVAEFNSFPQEIKSEGFTINLLRGTKIENGDSFLIRPTHSAAKSFAVEIERPNEIAAASPVRIRNSVHNLGNVKSLVGSITNINSPTFTTANKTLSPTITVRFIDETHIELLDDKGKVIAAQQLDAQNKTIPATPAVPGEKGQPATRAIPATPGDHGRVGKHESDDEIDVPFKIETGIDYDPEVGINLFPTPAGLDSGYSVEFSGSAKAGDTFVIEFNTDAVGNNINALELGDLQRKSTLSNGTSNYGEVYGQLVSRVGSKTHELDVNREAQNILYGQAKAQREAVSGVNLDEEAANLIKFQQAYEANAKVIGAASDMFDTLIGVLRR